MAITVVHTTSSQSQTVTIPSTTAGNCLVVCIASYAGSTSQATISGITLGGSAGNFAQLKAAHGLQAAGATFLDTFVWADPNCAGGQTSVAISGSNLGVNNGIVVIYEVSGLAATIGALLDQSAGAGSASNSTSWSSGATSATAFPSELWVGVAEAFDTITAPGGWTNTTQTFGCAGFQIASSTGTATYAGTQSPAAGWTALVVTLNAAGNAAASGTVQRRATVPLPRRRPSRAAWAGTLPLTSNASGPTAITASGWTVITRRPVTAVWGGIASSRTVQPLGPAGTIQPRATVPVPRRRAARAVQASGSGPANAHGGNGTVQPRATIPVPRRTSARAAWAAVLGHLNAHGPAGQVQPRAAVPVPRRTASRAIWAGQSTPQPHVPGSPPPLTGAPVVRRSPRQIARAVVGNGATCGDGQSTPQPHVPGSIQPRATIPVPRRYQARAQWDGGTGPANAHGPSGSVQPRASVPVPRRASARVLWQATLGALNAHGPSGSGQPRATVPVPRRQASRALWRGQSTPQPHVPGSVQPPTVIGRRSASRVLWRGTIVSTVNAAPAAPVTGTVQPHLVVARRAAARVMQHGTPVVTVNAAPVPPGTVQPRAAVAVPRRTEARVLWRGNAVPGQQPIPATGGLVKRRTATRALWRSVAGSPPPAAPGAAPVTGGRAVTRRPPSRGQWRGTVTRTSNALPVAVPAPRQRLTVPRRTAARAVVNGTVVTTSNGHGIPGLWALGRARQPWTTGRARLTWTTGRARNE